MKLTLIGDGKYALSLPEAERVFLVGSLVMSLTHTSDAEFEITTSHPKSAVDRYLDLLRQPAGEPGEYEFSLAQSDLSLLLTLLRLCVTHVSDAEYEVVIGRRKGEGAAELTDLEDQAEGVFDEWIRQESDRKDATQLVLKLMGDLSLLADEVIVERVATEASEQGKAINAAERRRTIVQQAKIDALLAELKRRGTDVNAVLAGLLGSDDAGVRLAAATKLLGSNRAAQLTMEVLADRRSPRLSDAAGLALWRWRQRRIQ
jgi:hypothetical protein